MDRLLRRLAIAVGTLTVLRLPIRGDLPAEELRASTAFYPLVGLGVGLVPALLLLLPLPPMPVAVLALTGWVVISGALHLDGWADCCDAAFAPARTDASSTRQRRLEILRDPHVGTFGLAGIVLLLLGKTAALLHVSPLAPLLAAPLARWAMVHVLYTYPPARREGLGATFGRDVPWCVASGIMAALLLLLVLLSASPGRVVGAATAGILIMAAVTRLLSTRFGGVTGDVCGAVGEAVELAVLWIFLA